MQKLWEDFGKKKVCEWDVGRFSVLSAANILRQKMYEYWSNEKESIEECYSEAFDKTEKGVLRIVREFGKSLDSSRGQELEKQFIGEFTDTMFFLSYFFASQKGRYCEEGCKTAMSYMWENLVQIKPLLNPSHSVQEAWESINCAWKESIILGRWHREPPIPRVSEKEKNRVNRLTLLGNGQVCDCTRWIAENILEWERVMKCQS